MRWILVSLALTLAACGAAKTLHPTFASRAAADAAVIPTDPFVRDRGAGISEEDLRRVLDAPVFLEERARLGVIRVDEGYKPSRDAPLAEPLGVLTVALQASGQFEVATEVSADWPVDSGLAGLRELAARYRAEYLLLYRHRFVENSYTNGWGWTFVVGVGVLFAPARTHQAAGVLEATLFDVKTGTVLFTVLERVSGESDETVWNGKRKRAELQARLMHKAASQLADKVVEKVQFLVAARPNPTEPTVSAVGAPEA